MNNDRIIISPAESFTLGQQFLQHVRDNRDRMVPLLLPGLDGYFAPMLPGELAVVIAQTHNGKSLFMSQWAQRILSHLKASGRDDEAVIWVDTEMPADYLAAGQISRETGIGYTDVVYSPHGLDMGLLMKAATRIASVPLYTVATRLGSKDGGAEVHLTNIRNGIRMLASGGVDGTKRRIAAIFVDYLQSLPIDPTVRKSPADQQRRLQVGRDVDLLRQMGSMFSCPVIVGVQAKQTLGMSEMTKALALPQIYDGMETANIAQRPDRIISLAVAARNFTVGQVLTWQGHDIVVTKDLLLTAVLKQRAFGGYLPAGDVFAYRMTGDPDPMKALVNVWSGWKP